jgi:choline monooxygenase
MPGLEKIDPDISKAKTLDTAFYNEQKYFELAKEKIFALTWQWAGDTDQLKDTGSLHPFTLLPEYLSEPLLLSKDKNGTIRCLSNVCTHRGNVLVSEPCKLSQITCRYHGRRFSLDGEFIFMPEFKEVRNFPSEADNLHQVSLYQWEKLLFVSLNPLVRGEDLFKEIRERMAWFPMNRLVLLHEHTSTYKVNANWALYCENYLEGFHIPFVHAGLNQVLDFGEYTTETFRYSNLQLGIGKENDDCFDLPEGSPDHGKKVAAYYFWVFPNLMLNFYPWGLSVNIVRPVSAGETEITFLTYTIDGKTVRTGAGADLHNVEMEDEEIVENVQRGVRSRFYDHGRYSATREQGTHHFHSLISEFINR